MKLASLWLDERSYTVDTPYGQQGLYQWMHFLPDAPVKQLADKYPIFVMSKLATQSWLAYQRKAASEEQRERLSSNLKGAEVEVRAFLGETTITVDDLLNLQPGDIVQTAKPAVNELTLQVKDRSKFAGYLYQHKGMRVFRVTRETEPDDPL